MGILFAASQTPMLDSLFKFRPNFRMVAITTVLLTGLVGMGIAVFQQENVGVNAYQILLSSVAWIGYLQLSRRVSVTYEHVVREDDPLAREEQGTQQGQPPLATSAPSAVISPNKAKAIRILEVVWYVSMAVAALYVAGPTLQKNDLAANEASQALQRGGYAVVMVVLLGLMVKNFYLKRIGAGILMLVLANGLGYLITWQHNQQVKDNDLQLATVSKQITESRLGYDQKISKLRGDYDRISGLITMVSAAKGKREAEDIKSKLTAMENLLDEMRTMHDRDWQDRFALVNSSRLPSSAKQSLIAVLKDRQSQSTAIVQRRSQLEKDNIQALRNAVDFIDLNRNAISVKGETMLFTNPGLLAEYKRRLPDVARTQAEQKRIQDDVNLLNGEGRK
jgi:hypothetical protein